MFIATYGDAIGILAANAFSFALAFFCMGGEMGGDDVGRTEGVLLLEGL